MNGWGGVGVRRVDDDDGLVEVLGGGGGLNVLVGVLLVREWIVFGAQTGNE